MKKLRYIPGIISIILLPILGIWYMNKHNYFQQFGALDIAYPDIEEDEEFEQYIREDFTFDYRNYTEITLDGNKEESKKKFQYVDNFTNKIIETKDTINGLKIHLGNQATYNEFIQLLNVLWEKPREIIWTIDNDTFILAGKDWSEYPIASADDFLICGGAFFTEEEPKSTFQQIWKNLKTQFSQNKIIYSAYIVFVLIVLVNFVQQRKKHLSN